jgi:hypothetical protein
MRMRDKVLGVLGLVAMFFGSEALAVCFVNQDATGKNDGTSWTNAYTNPQFALLLGCTEIWVAKGIYKPTSISDSTSTFEIAVGTKMYGGFAGGETAIEQRLPLTNRTVLSGDIPGAQTLHVVTIDPGPTGGELSPLLDGFVVSYGAAVEDEGEYGAGIFCKATGSYECSPILNNLVVTENVALYGGAISLDSSIVRAVLSNSIMVGNQAEFEGGAIWLRYSDPRSQPQFINVSFLQNASYSTGGAVNDYGGAAKFVNCTFYENSAAYETGGALQIWHGVPGSLVSLLNVTFTGNRANDASAVFDGESSALISLAIQNSIFWGNTSTTGSDISKEGTSLILVDDSVVQAGCPAGGSCVNITATEPLLVSVGNSENFSFVLSPTPGGSAYDAGNDGACPRTDQRGVSRPQGKHCDIGAVEWQPSDDTIFKNSFE